MFYFVADLLRDFGQYIPPELISEAALQTASPVNRRIPLQMVKTVGFEVRLPPQQAQADFLFRINAAERTMLAALKSPAFNDASWDKVRHFAHEWSHEHSPLYHYIENLWAEFDGVASRVTVPGVYIEPPLADDRHALNAPVSWKTDHATLFDHALPLLLGTPLEAAVRQQAEYCIEQAPAEANIFAAGLFLSRGADFLRLNFENITLPALIAYLQRIQWAGSLSDIEALWQTYFANVEQGIFRIALDIRQNVLPRLGIELHQWAVTSADAEIWNPVLNALIADGLCTPEKASALKTWIGQSKTKLPFHSEPMILRRGFGHIKLSYQPGQPLDAKAYLGFRFIPIPQVQHV